MKKLLIYLILSSIGLNAQSQSSLEFSGLFSIQRLNFYETAELTVLRPDTTVEQISRNGRISSHWVPSFEASLGYRITDNWSAGIQGSIALYIDSWNLIIPEGFRIFPSAGFYGKYLFNDVVGVLAETNINSYNINSNNSYTPNLSIGLGSQIFFSDRGLHFMFHYGFGGKRQLNMYGYDDSGGYTILSENHTNFMYLLEVGMITTITENSMRFRRR